MVLVEFKYSGYRFTVDKSLRNVKCLKEEILKKRGIPIQDQKIYAKSNQSLLLEDSEELPQHEILMLISKEDKQDRAGRRRQNNKGRKQKHARGGSVQGRVNKGNSLTKICCTFCRPTLSIQCEKRRNIAHEIGHYEETWQIEQELDMYDDINESDCCSCVFE